VVAASARPAARVLYDRPVALPASIPAPPFRELELGPAEIRLYALCILAGIAAAYLITSRRWRARGGDPDVLFEVLLWSVLAGLVGGRLYHVVTSWDQLGDEWYAPFAVWEGGLGIWGAIGAGAIVGAWVCHLRGGDVPTLLDAAAPALLVAQAIGRLGNYFNQELYGSATSLPWALEVDLGHRPVGSETLATYHPTFLYELLWNLAAAALIVWIGRRFVVRPPGLFALYVALYSAGRLIWERLRIDPSREFLGQRLNFYVALVLLVGALAVFVWTQRRQPAEPPAAAPDVPRTPGGRARPARRRA
jgi:prolipoprotein diacylglyceryl transferase